MRGYSNAQWFVSKLNCVRENLLSNGNVDPLDIFGAEQAHVGGYVNFTGSPPFGDEGVLAYRKFYVETARELASQMSKRKLGRKSQKLEYGRFRWPQHDSHWVVRGSARMPNIGG